MSQEQPEGQPSGFDTAEQIQAGPKGKPVGSPEVTIEGAARAEETMAQPEVPKPGVPESNGSTKSDAA